MKNLSNLISTLVLWLWSIFIKNPVTKTVKAITEGSASAAKKVNAAQVIVSNGKLILFKKFQYHVDNFAGRQLQKHLLEKGIVVLLYKMVAGKRKRAKYFMMMSHMNPVITATMDAPEDAEGRAKLGEKIQLKGLGTLYITISPILLAALTPLIKAVRDAVGPEQAETAWDNLNAALKEIMGLVQTFMNHNRDVAEICCVYYGFKVRGKGGASKQEWGGESGITTGTIDLKFEVGPEGCCYDILLWDRLHTVPPNRAQPTDENHATVPGLVSGALQAVSVNTILHGVVIHESTIIDVRVK